MEKLVPEGHGHAARDKWWNRICPRAFWFQRTGIGHCALLLSMAFKALRTYYLRTEKMGFESHPLLAFVVTIFQNISELG